jgi:NAD(P)-dependent dehydrogenase (short-subunit alcohol dehydrogenase family)
MLVSTKNDPWRVDHDPVVHVDSWPLADRAGSRQNIAGSSRRGESDLEGESIDLERGADRADGHMVDCALGPKEDGVGRLEGKVAVVTGAGGERGLGRAMAQRFAAEGADLVLVDVERTGVKAVAGPASAWAGLEAVADDVRTRGRRALTALADVREAGQVAAFVERALEAFGRIDVLVNNAGAPAGADRVPVVDLSEDAWDAVIDVNLKGTFLCSRAVARTMLERGVRGRILNVASNWGKVGGARRAAYCASKFGVIGFTQSLALELGPAGITVNAICPGAADTERLDHMGRRPDGTFDEALRAERVAQAGATVPVGRVARAADVAEVAAFLAGAGAEYITGQAINVAGGSVMH